MSCILIDTCIVTDLADPHSRCFEWSASTLEHLDRQHTFIINPIGGFETIEEVEALFEYLGFALQSLPKEALFLAGKVFLQYKKKKA